MPAFRAPALRPRNDPTPLDPATVDPAPLLLPPVASRGGRGGLWSFIGLVLVPAMALAVYFLVLAADQYVATARFTVREIGVPSLSADRTAASGGTGLFASDAPSPFTAVAASYVTSAAILDDLAPHVDLRALMNRDEADFWARLGPHASREQLHRQWLRHVRVSIDRTSGIVTVRLRAFRPDDALDLAKAVLAATEALVNALSRRQRLDALDRARAEAATAEARLREAVTALSALRDAAGTISPLQEAGETLRLLTQLTAERIALDVEIRGLDGALRGDTARLRLLTERRDRIERDVAALRASLAGRTTTDANLAAALGQFELLEVRRQFAAKLYEMTQARLIAAELDLSRQAVYLHVFEPPGLPQDARYPERWAFSAIAFLSLLTLWGIGVLIWASVEDHRMA
jgi:capsular polysaccharide transport system permease protein